MKKLVLLVLFLFLVGTTYFAGGLYYGWIGKLEQVGSIQGKIIPDRIISQRTKIQNDASKNLGVKEPKQILFGDLHVHTTFSTDAFMWTLPMLNAPLLPIKKKVQMLFHLLDLSGRRLELRHLNIMVIRMLFLEILRMKM